MNQKQKAEEAIKEKAYDHFYEMRAKTRNIWPEPDLSGRIRLGDAIEFAINFHQSLVNNELKDLLIWMSKEPNFNISKNEIKEIIEDYTYFKKGNHD